MTLERCEFISLVNKVEVSGRHPTPEATCTGIDGCAPLWIPQ